MNRNHDDSDFTAREAALAERLREWDPAGREAPPSEAEQLWFRERLLAEARTGASSGSDSFGGWVRLAAVVGALLLITVSVVLLRRDGLSAPRPVLQAEAPAAEPAPGGSEVTSTHSMLEESKWSSRLS